MNSLKSSDLFNFRVTLAHKLSSPPKDTKECQSEIATPVIFAGRAAWSWKSC